jgi:hypothetical protein
MDTADALDELEDLPSVGSAGTVGTETAVQETAFANMREEPPEQCPAPETFQDWFGNEDVAEISFQGTLREQNGATRLLVRGEDFVSSLDADARAYCEETFIPTLLEKGRAAWPGAETPDGGIQEGVIATLAPRGEVTFVYGRTAEKAPKTEPIAETPVTQEEFLESLSDEIIVSLDQVV